MFNYIRNLSFFSFGLFGLVSCGNLLNDRGPSPPKTPDEELASFQLAEGLSIQLVASEPMVQDPVVITFDEDGRLWVVEMRGFMPDIDGNGEDQPVGRVSVLEDQDGDGQIDVSTVYIDSLIMPRALAVVKGGALIVENQALWLTQDNDGDLKADTKILIDPDYAGTNLPEHSGNGLWRGVDNWYYNVKSRFRYKLIDGTWQRDSTEFRGQWGLSHDDEGRLIYNYNWSQLHADLVPPNYLSRNKHHTPTTGIDHGLTINRKIYPIRPNPAVNRGYIPGTLDDDDRLLEFTSACSPLFYRSTLLPEEYYGNVFVCEPAGNLIKRNVVETKGNHLAAYDPHPGREFLASTDERFRPVYLATGPDGALYIADMYRGLVQHGAHVTPYLREQTITRKLVHPINYGRIWRIVPENGTVMKPEKLLVASSEALVGYLSHPNGWYRDVAQRLLVDRNDESVVPLLIDVALTSTHTLGKFHALWTLEGMKQTAPYLLLNVLSDKDPLIKSTALRLLEPFAKADRKWRAKIGLDLLDIWIDEPDVYTLQVALTAGVLDMKASHSLLSGILAKYDTSSLVRDAIMSSLQDKELTFLRHLSRSPWYRDSQPAKEIFLEMLTTSIVRRRDPAELSELLAMINVGKNNFDWQENTILTALSIQASSGRIKPVALTSPPAILTRSDSDIPHQRKKSIASMFEWPGHSLQADSTKTITTLSERDQQLFALGRQYYVTSCAACHGMNGEGLARYGPPLAGSDWVVGDEKRLALLVLHGIEGPIEVSGRVYDEPDILPVMPSHSTLADAAITSILTYIRNEWGNNAGPLSRGLVGRTRHTTQGRVVPWTANELNRHMQDANVPNSK